MDSLKKNSKILIVILNWNGKKDTLVCLSSLQKLTYPSYQVLVVDNGSTDDSVDAFRPLGVEILETGKNLGYAGGNNAGIEWGLKRDFNLFFILNNDTEVAPDILERFVEGFAKEPTAGILGGKIFLMDQRTRFDHFGGIWNSEKANFDLIGQKELEDGKRWQEMFEIEYVCGAALMVKREVLQSVGLLDPRFFLLWEEADLCFRARRAGYQVMVCPQAILWHKGSASFSGKPLASYFFSRNRLLWMERNLPWKKRIRPLLKIFGETLKMVRLKTLKKLQLYVRKKLRPEEDFKAREERIARYSASLEGVKDFLFRRFGPRRP